MNAQVFILTLNVEKIIDVKYTYVINKYIYTHTHTCWRKGHGLDMYIHKVTHIEETGNW